MAAAFFCWIGREESAIRGLKLCGTGGTRGQNANEALQILSLSIFAKKKQKGTTGEREGTRRGQIEERRVRKEYIYLYRYK